MITLVDTSPSNTKTYILNYPIIFWIFLGSTLYTTAHTHYRTKGKVPSFTDYQTYCHLIEWWNLLFLTAYWHLGGGKPAPQDHENYWTYDHEVFTRCQIPQGDTTSKRNFDITHLVCKLCLEMQFLDMQTLQYFARLSILMS